MFIRNKNDSSLRVNCVLQGRDVLMFSHFSFFCLFWEAAFCWHGSHMCSRWFGSASSDPSSHSAAHKNQLLASNKSHVLSPPPLWTWLDLYSQYATLSLIISGYWSLLWEQQPWCCRGNVQQVMHYMEAWLPCCLMILPCWNIRKWQPAGRNKGRL